MGMIGQILNLLFGGHRNVVVETAELFQENSEQAGKRAQSVQLTALGQFSDEFRPRQRGYFDRLMDGVNRLPRPAMALGCIGLCVAAMLDPVWFAMRMQGMSLVPEPLWWLLGVIVSFYFGARHQAKGQEFQRSIVDTMARTPEVMGRLADLQALATENSGPADQIAPQDIAPDDGNAALEYWRRNRPGNA